MTVTRIPDHAARERIEREFDRNFLVEAGAGSGKTHSLARRMAAGIAAGHYRVEEMAAVTFTRKAAAELRGRFQAAIEERLSAADGGGGPDAPPHDPEQRERLETALAGIERLFAGTIHAFCAHLLRERPVEARVAPGFQELDDAEDRQLRADCWRDFVVRRRAEGWGAILDLQKTGVRPSDLDDAFGLVCGNEDVEFPPGEAAKPDAALAWAALDSFIEQLEALCPKPLPDDSTCKVMALLDEFRPRFRYARRRKRPDALATLLGDWSGKSLTVTQRCWDGKGARAKAVVEAFRQDVALPFLTRWRAYVYRLSLVVINDGREFYAHERRRRNVVNYVDLLMMAARLLRTNPSVRHALQWKYRWLFIDEFQDTDPIQAEIFVLLAADEARAAAAQEATGAGSAWPDERAPDWAAVRLRPGALFVVGDPKQSIYRFRRADIDIYNRVRALIQSCGGEVLHLTANFRSLPGVCALVNSVGPTLFGRHDARHSPAFERLHPLREDGQARPAIVTLTTPASVDRAREATEFEADRLARFIRGEVDAGRRHYGDFLVLTRNRPRLGVYAEAFDAAEIPVEVSGAGRFGDSGEVAVLALLLRVLGDPLDAVSLVGVLRGPLFGLSDPELFQYRQAGGRFDLNVPWPEAAAGATAAAAPGPVLEAMRFLGELRRHTRRLPLGSAVDRILEDTGWLALAATSPGGARAGDLLQAVDRVRHVVETGGDLIDAAASLTAEEDESSDVEALPLEPGRRDVVRLMNLHKAKGLEAPVVILADPAHGWKFDVDIRVVRDRDVARGYIALTRRWASTWGMSTVGVPEGWDAHKRLEGAYRDAEEARLLYVAATRARDLLVVGRWARTTKDGASQNKAWAEFDRFLRHVPELEIGDGRGASVRGRATGADVSMETRAAATASRDARSSRAAAPSWAARSVTGDHVVAAIPRFAELPGLEVGTQDPTSPLLGNTAAHRVDAGVQWGALIHGLLEHAMRRPDASRADLERLARWLTVEASDLRPLIPQAVEVAQAVSGADFWRDARHSQECHVEIPFAVCDLTRPAVVSPEPAEPAPETARSTARADRAEALPTVIRGVIDLVYRTGEGWRIVDYKTDQDTGVPGTLAARHREQLAAYGRAWSVVARDPAPRAAVFGVRVLRTEWHEGTTPSS